MKINLTVNLSGAALSLSYEDSQVITVGRDTENSIAPVEVAGLSRKHAKIFYKDEAWYIEDLGSTNGTFVQGEKIESAVKLKISDKIQLGKFSMVVEGSWVEVAAPQPPVANVNPAVEKPSVEKDAVVKPVTPVAPAAVNPVKPASPVAFKPVITKPASPLSPVEAAAPKTVEESIPDLPPVEKPAAEKPAAASVLTPVKPAVGGIRPGLKLPAGKPVMKPGLKLPSTGLKPGLKLPTGGAKPGLKPGLKLPPKPVAGLAIKRPVINKPAEESK
jgi:predicted component of type VI protein secretion system